MFPSKTNWPASKRCSRANLHSLTRIFDYGLESFRENSGCRDLRTFFRHTLRNYERTAEFDRRKVILTFSVKIRIVKPKFPLAKFPGISARLKGFACRVPSPRRHSHQVGPNAPEFCSESDLQISQLSTPPDLDQRPERHSWPEKFSPRRNSPTQTCLMCTVRLDIGYCAINLRNGQGLSSMAECQTSSVTECRTCSVHTPASLCLRGMVAV